jgi:hypothetical protein
VAVGVGEAVVQIERRVAPLALDVGAVGDQGAMAFEADVLGARVEVAGGRFAVE